LGCFPTARYYQHQGSGQEGPALPLSFSALFFTRNQLPVLGLAIGLLLCLKGVPRPAIFGSLVNPLIHISA